MIFLFIRKTSFQVQDIGKDEEFSKCQLSPLDLFLRTHYSRLLRIANSVVVLIASRSDWPKISFLQIKARFKRRILHAPNQSLVLICQRPTWDNGGICENLLPTHNLSQALTAGLPAKLNSVQLRKQAAPAINSWDRLWVGDKCSRMPQRSPRPCRRPRPR